MTKATAAALSRFRKDFEKDFGEGSIKIGGDIEPYSVIPTGSLNLDLALGVGGYVQGRVTEIYGPEGLGKTTLALIGLANAQRVDDRMVGIVDMEHTIDERWCEIHGVDRDRLALHWPANAEDTADALKKMIRSGLFSAVLVDSVGGMISEVEKQKQADEDVVAKVAKVVTRMVNIASADAPAFNVAVLIINQMRSNISAYGAATGTPGGWALKYASTHKLKVRRTGTKPYEAVTEDGEKVEVGHELAITVERNKVASPKRTAHIALLHTPSILGPPGVDQVDEIATLGIDFEVIQKSGGWYTAGEEEAVQGRPALVALLRENPGLCEQMKEQISLKSRGLLESLGSMEDEPGFRRSGDG